MNIEYKNKGVKFLYRFMLTLLFVMGSLYSPLFSQTYIFTTSGNTINFPIGTSIKVEAWGAGGRGGSSGTGGGGGGGAYASSVITVTQATAYRVNVGTGSSSNTTSGGDSWFAPDNNVSNAIVLAKGGSSATNDGSRANGAAGGSYSASKGDIRNNGGRGANVTSSNGGGGGSSAGATGLGVNATNQFGAVGPTGNDGVGGNGATSDGVGSAAPVGINGNTGGGGGGARGNNTGGAGANGRVIITVLGPQSDITTTGTVQTWVAPAGINTIEVETWAGGGRGGSGTTTNQTLALGGGGGGGYSRSLLSVTSGTTYYVNVGSGSASGTTAGGDSWFSTTNVTGGSLVRAKGGNSVADNTASGASGGTSANTSGNAIGTVRFSGGNGANGSGTNGGGGGSSASPSSNGLVGSSNIGGSIAGGGSGGNGRTANNGPGLNGSIPGGGGGGAYKTGTNNPTGGNGANGKVTIHTFYNLSIAKTVTSTTPLVGTNVTFTITVRNNGTNNANGIVVTDVFPTGITYVSNTGTATFNTGTNSLTWNAGSLAPAATASITFVATVNTSGNYANTATMVANLPNNGNNSSMITLFPQKPTADLQLTKEVNNVMPLVTGQVVFTLTAYNAGPQNATGVKVEDILPFGFTHVSNSGGFAPGTSVWTIGNLNKGATQTLTITATVNTSGNYYNQATISGDQIDPNEANNTSGIQVYPMYPIIEVVLPCATTTYNLTNFTIATPPAGSQVSWHTASPASDSNKIATPTNVRAGQVYYVAFYNTADNCYGATSQVLIKRSCLITNPMIRQRTK